MRAAVPDERPWLRHARGPRFSFACWLHLIESCRHITSFPERTEGPDRDLDRKLQGFAHRACQTIVEHKVTLKIKPPCPSPARSAPSRFPSCSATYSPTSMP